MLVPKIHCQNLAYCRYLQIWSILYLLHIVRASPLISLDIVSFFHLYSIDLSTKRMGILFQDYVLMGIIYTQDTKIYVYENILFFVIYLQILTLLHINPIKVYQSYLPADDEKYKTENYYQYQYRIWKLFFCNCKKIEMV